MTRKNWRTSTVAALLTMAVATGTTGCAVTVENLPMPEPGLGAPGYTIHAAFRDALNLPARAHVKIGGTDIGVVTAISSKDFVATVDMLIREDIRLPRGTTAELRQGTPLGEIFVAMTLPSAQEAGEPLHGGDTIGIDRTGTAASVEQLMMSIAMLLNGGGINQAARITAEMDSMVGGRAPQLAHLFTKMTEVIAALNQRTGDIDGALTGLHTLAGELARRKDELGAAADSFPQLLAVLAENNQQLVDVITKVATTTDALGDFAGTTGNETVSLFGSIQKLMSSFTQMGGNLNSALENLHTVYPGLMATTDGPTLAVGATWSSLSLGALTDPSGSRLPELGDVPAFIGSLVDVIGKVIGRLQSQPQPPQQGGGR